MRSWTLMVRSAATLRVSNHEATMGHALAHRERSRLSAYTDRAVLAHHLHQHALAQAAIGDPQPRQRKRTADRVENGAARQHQIGALDADAVVAGAFLIAHGEQARDNSVDIRIAQPDPVD